MEKNKAEEKVGKEWFAMKIRKSRKLTFMRKVEEGVNRATVSGRNVLGRGRASAQTLRRDKLDTFDEWLGGLQGISGIKWRLREVMVDSRHTVGHFKGVGILSEVEEHVLFVESRAGGGGTEGSEISQREELALEVGGQQRMQLVNL